MSHAGSSGCQHVRTCQAAPRPEAPVLAPWPLTFPASDSQRTSCPLYSPKRCQVTKLQLTLNSPLRISKLPRPRRMSGSPWRVPRGWPQVGAKQTGAERDRACRPRRNGEGRRQGPVTSGDVLGLGGPGPPLPTRTAPQASQRLRPSCLTGTGTDGSGGQDESVA